MKIKILSYNIHKGFDWNNRNYFLKEIKDFISSTEADIVCLQEVVGKNSKYKDMGLIDAQFEYLAEELWPHFSYAQNAVYDHGHHGNLILSKYPIESFENIDLSTNRYEKRGLLICKIKLSDNYLYAGCSHLNLLHAGRLIQYEMIRKEIELKDDQITPFVIAGDFNDWNNKCINVFENELKMQEVYKSLNGTFAKTFPAAYPLLRLDRIYVKNLLIKKVKICQPRTAHSVLEHLSDHLALCCEVEAYGP